MGSTRHMKQSRHLTGTEWTLFTKQSWVIMKKYFEMTKKLGDANGITVEYRTHHYQVNGSGAQGHEAFTVCDDAIGRTSCKTAVKPYDLFVAALMLNIKRIAPDAVRIRADGNNAENFTEDWAEPLQCLCGALDLPLSTSYDPIRKGVEINDQSAS